MKTLSKRLLAALTLSLIWTGGSVVTGQAAGQKLVFLQDPSQAGCPATLTGGTAWPNSGPNLCQPVVQIQDLTGSPLDVQDSITIAITPPNTTSGALTCSSGVSLTASASKVSYSGCKIDKTGTYSLTATDTTSLGTAAAVTGTFTIAAGPAAKFAVTGLANPSTAGTAQTVTVTAQDAGGNSPSPNYQGHFTLASSDAHATFPAGSPYNLSGNTGTFQVTLNTKGSQTVTATDTTTSSITGTDGPVVVNPGPLATITLSPSSASTAAGVQETYTTEAFDAEGNDIGPATTATSFSITPDGACTGGTGTNGAAPGNNKCTSTTADTGGSSHTIHATDGAAPEATASLTVNAGPGLLGFTSQPDQPNVVVNGGFETGSFTQGWTPSGSPAPSVVSSPVYSGSDAAFLGGTAGPTTPGDSQISQSFTVPATGHPMLTFLYWASTTATSGDLQKATVTCGSCGAQSSVTVFSTLSNSQLWHPVQFDLTYAAGKVVDVVFDAHQAGGAGATAMYVDDVAVSGQAAGSAFAIQPVVQVEDSSNNHIAASGVHVTLGLASGAGNGTPGAGLTCTGGLTQVTDANGQAAFTGCQVDTTGYNYELTATDTTGVATTYGSGQSLPFAATGQILWFGTSPSSSTGGVAFSPHQPAVQSLNGDGSVNTSDTTTTVQLGITPGTGAAGAVLTCTGGDSKTVASGVASFAGCAIDKASGTQYSLTATAPGSNIHPWTATSAAFTITAGPTSQFAVSGLATPSTAGAGQQVTVRPEDAGGNAPGTAYSGPVFISFSPAGSGTSNPTSVSAGGCSASCNFMVQLNKSGTDTVTAGNAASSPTITGSETVTVNPGATTGFEVDAPGSATAGHGFSITVTAQDAQGNTTPAYAGTVHFTSTDTGSPSLPADQGLTNGTATLNVTLNTAGSQTVTATDKNTASITGTSGAIQVAPSTLDHIVVTPATDTITAGDPAVVYQANAYDSHGNFLADVTSQAAWSITPDGGCTGGTGTNGAAPGNNQCDATTSGPHTVTATYLSKSNGATLNVNPGSATSLSVSAPSTATAGAPFNVTVTAQDSFGNTDTNYAGTVQFSSTDASAFLPASSGLTNGTRSFPVTLITAGTQTVTATDTVTSSITGTSGDITVNPGPALSFDVSASASTTAGQPINVTVTAKDPYDNTVTGYSGTVHFTSTDPQAALPANSALTNGTGTFPVTLKTQGEQTVTATDAANSNVTGTSGDISVSPAGVHSILLTPQDASTGLSSPVAYTATSYDVYGNALGDVTGLTVFSINGGGTCRQAGGSTSAPGNNRCGAGSYGSYTVTGNYSGLTNSTTLFVDQGWTQLPGSARDVGAWGSNLWVVGTNAQPGGYGIYHWTGSGWVPAPGGATRIAVGPSGQALAMNAGGSIYRWNGGGWQQLPGSATDVAVGGSGSDAIFVLGTNAVPGGYGIYHWTGSGWAVLPGGGVRIAVGPDGNPDVVNSAGSIYHWTGSGWQQLPGSAHDIGVGSNGALWVIGTNVAPGGYGIYQWNGGGFSPVAGGATAISVGSSGRPVVVNSGFNIYQRN